MEGGRKTERGKDELTEGGRYIQRQTRWEGQVERKDE